MDLEDDKQKHLYKVEYFEPEDNTTYTDWVWLYLEEVNEYRSGYKFVKVRRATEDEESLYEEAYEDGYSIAMIMEMRSVDNGVTFRVEIGADGDLDMGHKMFKCAVCNTHKDFNDNAAKNSGYYLTTLVEDVLWHLCTQCVELSSEIDSINIDD